MKIKRTTEITSEVEEIIVFRQGKTLIELCPYCQELTTMASPYAIALLTGEREREIFRLIETGKVHFIEENFVLVCLSCIQSSKERILKT